MDLKQVLTIKEAAAKWGLDTSTLRYACIKKKFSDTECRKAAGTWLITTDGMERVYGKKDEKSC